MDNFAVFSNGVLVGHSMLEGGDPPMGVAFGTFVPTADYGSIEHHCKTNLTDQSSLRLTVRSRTGVELECAGVGILDYSAEADEQCIEVNVLGISYPPYEELFPNHVASYAQQFRDR
jgi:hypothetical protein